MMTLEEIGAANLRLAAALARGGGHSEEGPAIEVTQEFVDALADAMSEHIEIDTLGDYIGFAAPMDESAVGVIRDLARKFGLRVRFPDPLAKTARDRFGAEAP